MGSLEALALGRIFLSLIQFKNSFSMLERSMELSQLPTFFFEPIALLKLFPEEIFFSEIGPFFWKIIAVVLCLSAVGSILGYQTRWSLFSLSVIQTFLVGFSYSFKDYHHDQALPILAGFFLCLTPCGERFSIQRTRGSLDRKGGFNWFFVFIYSFLGIIYFSSGVAKLVHSSADWLSGRALIYHVHQDALANSKPWGIWISQQLFLCVGLSWFTLFFQLFFWLGLFNRKLRLFFVLTAICFHLTTDLLMKASFLGFVGVLLFFLPGKREGKQI